MSNSINDKLRDEFLDSLEEVGLCPYCMDRVRLEPTDLCCGEVHGEVGYETPDGEYLLESDLDAAFKAWLSKRGES